MSTMYYTYPARKQVGQVHSLGKDKGYHFTWSMYPDEFASILLNHVVGKEKILFLVECFIDEHEQRYSFGEFRGIVQAATSQSFDERIE